MNSIFIFVHRRDREERREKLKQVNFLLSQSEIQKACGQKKQSEWILILFYLFSLEAILVFWEYSSTIFWSYPEI
jgi:hypothetical protein